LLGYQHFTHEGWYRGSSSFQGYCGIIAVRGNARLAPNPAAAAVAGIFGGAQIPEEALTAALTKMLAVEAPAVALALSSGGEAAALEAAHEAAAATAAGTGADSGMTPDERRWAAAIRGLALAPSVDAAAADAACAAATAAAAVSAAAVTSTLHEQLPSQSAPATVRSWRACDYLSDDHAGLRAALAAGGARAGAVSSEPALPRGFATVYRSAPPPLPRSALPHWIIRDVRVRVYPVYHDDEVAADAAAAAAEDDGAEVNVLSPSKRPRPAGPAVGSAGSDDTLVSLPPPGQSAPAPAPTSSGPAPAPACARRVAFYTVVIEFCEWMWASVSLMQAHETAIGLRLSFVPPRRRTVVDAAGRQAAALSAPVARPLARMLTPSLEAAAAAAAALADADASAGSADGSGSGSGSGGGSGSGSACGGFDDLGDSDAEHELGMTHMVMSPLPAPVMEGTALAESPLGLGSPADAEADADANAAGAAAAAAAVAGPRSSPDSELSPGAPGAGGLGGRQQRSTWHASLTSLVMRYEPERLRRGEAPLSTCLRVVAPIDHE
jgi:hypothetical protein